MHLINIHLSNLLNIVKFFINIYFPVSNKHDFLTDKAKNYSDIPVERKHFLNSSNEMIILDILLRVTWDARG